MAILFGLAYGVGKWKGGSKRDDRTDIEDMTPPSRRGRIEGNQARTPAVVLHVPT